MPTTPYAKVRAQINGGSFVSGGITVAPNDVITLTGEDTAFWTNALWRIYGFPVGFPTPSGWTLHPSGYLYSTSFAPATITMPNGYSLWGKFGIELVVNDGAKNGVANDDMRDRATMLSLQSVAGLRDICDEEENQFTGWSEEFRALLRTLEAAVGHSTKSVQTTDATATLLASYPMTVNSRQYVLRAQVSAVGDFALANSALFDIVVVYTRSNAGVLTQRLATVTALYRTNASYNVTATLNGSALEIKAVGVAATNLRWHLTDERWKALSYT